MGNTVNKFGLGRKSPSGSEKATHTATPRASSFPWVSSGIATLLCAGAACYGFAAAGRVTDVINIYIAPAVVPVSAHQEILVWALWSLVYTGFGVGTLGCVALPFTRKEYPWIHKNETTRLLFVASFLVAGFAIGAGFVMVLSGDIDVAYKATTAVQTLAKGTLYAGGVWATFLSSLLLKNAFPGKA